MPRTFTLSRALVVALALGLAACDSGKPGCDTDCPPTGSGGDVIVAGVNTTQLFARPTGAEIDAVLAAWRQGPPPDSLVSLRAADLLELGGRETVRVVEGVRDNRVVFAAAVRQPPRAQGDVTRRPLLLVLGEGPDANVAALIQDLAIREEFKDDVVMVFMTYRGGTLQVAGRSYASAAPSDPYAADAEDARTLIEGLQGVTNDIAIDYSRRASVGFGRGGNVALLESALARARDREVPSYILSLSAPTSFFTTNSELAARQFLQGRPAGPLPGIEGVLEATAARVRDGELTIEQARLALLRRSSSFFYAPPRLTTPPFIFAAYGDGDDIVPLQDARAFSFLTGRPNNGLYVELEMENHTSVQRNAQVLGGGGVILCERLLDSTVGGCQ